MLVDDHHYRDAGGTLPFRVERHAPKRFAAFDAAGRELAAVPARALYRRPELLAAPTTALVFVVEGEKDVETLRTLGKIATSNAGGAAGAGTRP